VQLGIVAIVFALVFVAELPDKTMIATLIMGSRYRPLLVWIGATVAFAIHAGLAVAVGQLLQLLPHRWIEAVTAGLFAGGAAYLLFVPEKVQEEEGEKEADTTHRGAKTIGAAFLVIFVGEFGDLTQILTANLRVRGAGKRRRLGCLRRPGLAPRPSSGRHPKGRWRAPGRIRRVQPGQAGTGLRGDGYDGFGDASTMNW
jgi:hypothetical protein